ncbi:NUDIX hydrolase [Sinorhizobium sp. BG8]|uniref:NUDIX hydrolase n=1 Tax=Sinorhizobium sp. BG8 TaxID=2613773 RepID=UPI00193D43D6|nr:NUDIX hydrolase [Sinorhizobium sp. BG8]QRM56829.1 NUDIX hydrolase [Sinorhizobium sp. BG8]
MNILNRLAGDVHLMFRRPARVQYAALCYRFRKKRSVLEVLLITSRDTGRWVIPKGWPMANRDCHGVAEREAYEEAGVKGKVGKMSIGHYMYQKGLAEGLKVSCKVQVYALEVEDICKNYPEKGERRMEWVSCAEAARRVNEPGLKNLFLAFEKSMPVEPALPASK